jgi:signal transduction histidine kinase
MSLLGWVSLDELRASIASRLGREIGGEDPEEDVSSAVGRLLLDEARENESRIATLRVLLAGLYTSLAAIAALGRGSAAAIRPLAAVLLWMAVSVVLLAALRRGWYRLWLRRLLPAADALAIALGAVFASTTLADAGTRAAIAGNAAVLCALLTFTGALRLTRNSARLAAVLSVLAFLSVALVARLAPLQTAGLVAALIAVSVLAGRVIDAVRRVVSNQVGRLAVERQAASADARAAEAQAASAAREEVLRMVSHDLRNPLSTILMGTDLLLEPGVPDAVRAKQVATIKRAGARMNALIRDLLNVARLETGTLAVDPVPVSPSLLVSEAIEMMRPLATVKSLGLESAVADGLPSVLADPERIGQVFSNLVGNAIKFTPPGGRITVGAVSSEGRVWFSVTDTGPGIPPEQLERIFGPFWQARRKDDRGIGLGLTIAKGIVEAHGGKIGVDSEVGIGTKFWFGLGGPTTTERSSS